MATSKLLIWGTRNKKSCTLVLSHIFRDEAPWILLVWTALSVPPAPLPGTFSFQKLGVPRMFIWKHCHVERASQSSQDTCKQSPGLSSLLFGGWPPGGGLPWWPDGKDSACNAEDLGLIPGLGRSPGEGNGHPLQYSCLENSMDRGAWQAIVHGVAERYYWVSNMHTHTHTEWNTPHPHGCVG